MAHSASALRQYEAYLDDRHRGVEQCQKSNFVPEKKPRTEIKEQVNYKGSTLSRFMYREHDK